MFAKNFLLLLLTTALPEFAEHKMHTIYFATDHSQALPGRQTGPGDVLPGHTQCSGGLRAQGVAEGHSLERVDERRGT